MTKKVSNLSDYKQQKKSKQIVEDLAHILHIFDLTQRSLGFFKKYKTVQIIISELETHVTLLGIQKKKIEKQIDE